MTLVKKSERSATNNGESPAKQEQPTDIVMTSAPPPLPIVALVGLLFTIFVTLFPSLENIDGYATVETFTNRVFPSLLSVKALAWIRLDIAAFCFFVSYRGSFIDPGYVSRCSIMSVYVPVFIVTNMYSFCLYCTVDGNRRRPICHNPN